MAPSELSWEKAEKIVRAEVTWAEAGGGVLLLAGGSLAGASPWIIGCLPVTISARRANDAFRQGPPIIVGR